MEVAVVTAVCGRKPYALLMGKSQAREMGKPFSQGSSALWGCPRHLGAFLLGSGGLEKSPHVHVLCGINTLSIWGVAVSALLVFSQWSRRHRHRHRGIVACKVF